MITRRSRRHETPHASLAMPTLLVAAMLLLVIQVTKPPATFAEPSVDDLIAASMLTEADVPDYLRENPRSRRTVDNDQQRGEVVAFGRPTVLRQSDLTALPQGAIYLVIAILGTPLGGSSPASLDEWVGTIPAITPGLRDLRVAPPPPVGDDSRAVTYRTPLVNDSRGPIGTSRDHYQWGLLSIDAREDSKASAIVVFQRGELYASITVMAVGDDAPMDEAIRLAQTMDRRLVSFMAQAQTDDVRTGVPTPHNSRPQVWSRGAPWT